jgi:Na+/melibiose symporter-like transporter
VLIVWELLPIMLPRLSMRGWPTAVISALLAIAVALFTLLKTINDNEFQTGWAWVGLGIALAIALTALLRVRFRWRTRDVRPAAEPEAEPRPE